MNNSWHKGMDHKLVGRFWWLLVGVLLTYAPAAQGFERGGVTIEAKTIKLSRTTDQIEASGNVHLSAINSSSKVKLVADARKVTITLLTSANQAGQLRGIEAIKSAEFEGPVKMVYAAPKMIKDDTGKNTTQVMVTTTATADRATFDGLQGVAILLGNVKVVQDDPSIFAEPAVMTGDKASINLKSAREPGEYDFRIESSDGPSRIEIVPRQLAKQ